MQKSCVSWPTPSLTEVDIAEVDHFVDANKMVSDGGAGNLAGRWETSFWLSRADFEVVCHLLDQLRFEILVAHGQVRHFATVGDHGNAFTIGRKT